MHRSVAAVFAVVTACFWDGPPGCAAGLSHQLNIRPIIGKTNTPLHVKVGCTRLALIAVM